ncbi:MAG: hypothetical protein AAGA29_11440 [Planctomycetota bacterium]
MKPVTPTLLAAAIAISLPGCGGSDRNTDADYPEGIAPVDESQGDTPAPGDAGDAGDASTDAAVVDGPADEAQGDGTHSVQGLVYTVPEGWAVGPARQMRVLTLEAGEGVEIAVGYWPNGVGGIEANLTRWLGQAGYNPADLESMQRVRDGFTSVTIGDADATWMPLLEGSAGTPMIGVWIPRGDNPTAQSETWTFKITGTADALRDKQDELRAWAESLSFE